MGTCGELRMLLKRVTGAWGKCHSWTSDRVGAAQNQLAKAAPAPSISQTGVSMVAASSSRAPQAAVGTPKCPLWRRSRVARGSCHWVGDLYHVAHYLGCGSCVRADAFPVAVLCLKLGWTTLRFSCNNEPGLTGGRFIILEGLGGAGLPREGERATLRKDARSCAGPSNGPVGC
jgi:hypothetical protein